MKKDSLGAKEDASKQRRMIEEIDQNAEIALDDETLGRINDDEMFRVDDLAGEEVVMDTTTGEHEEQIIEDISAVEPITTADEVVTTTTVKDSAAPTTDVTEDKITMAQALAALKSIKPKVVRQAKMIEPEVPIKKKDQMRIHEELQAREMEEFSEVQKARLEMRKVNDFIALDSEAQKSSAKEAQESNTKRTPEHLESDISKKKVDENVEPVIDDSEELKKCMEIVPDDGDAVLIEATSLSSRSSTIIDYKIHKE
uniref:Uncharacterized protein n=1 Tax=Tanacetum cinerariifolium TaxID=118510 RepID=A0A699KUI9_TANCI|nr:hypothetical protein [Tanacetum cinerariifolium]